MHGVVLCCIVVAFLCGWYKEKRDVESKILSCSLHTSDSSAVMETLSYHGSNISFIQCNQSI